jgi:hypothetical protein
MKTSISIKTSMRKVMGMREKRVSLVRQSAVLRTSVLSTIVSQGMSTHFHFHITFLQSLPDKHNALTKSVGANRPGKRKGASDEPAFRGAKVDKKDKCVPYQYIPSLLLRLTSTQRTSQEAAGG